MNISETQTFYETDVTDENMPTEKKTLSTISSLKLSKQSGDIQVLSFLGLCIRETNVGNVDADEAED